MGTFADIPAGTTFEFADEEGQNINRVGKVSQWVKLDDQHYRRAHYTMWRKVENVNRQVIICQEQE